MPISIKPIDATLGAIITDVSLASLDEATWADIHAAFLQYGVLVFPGQHLDAAAQGRFAARFGALEQMSPRGETPTFPIANIKADGSLALNFGRLNDPEINRLLDLSRSETDPDARRGYAEDVNRRFASECYVIPTSYTNWGVISSPAIIGIGTLPQPDGNGGFVRDGAGFSGQVWLTSVFKAE